MKKLVLASLVCTSLFLGACKEEEAVEIEEAVVEVDYTEASSNYKSDMMPILTSFVEDAKLLQTHMEEGKLDEAQKLYPLVHMYVEKIQPLRNQFNNELATIDGEANEESGLTSGGLHAIEYALFKEEDPSKGVEAASKLVDNLTEFANVVAKEQLDGKALLTSTSSMLERSLNEKLMEKETNLANAQVYDIQANLEAVQMVVKVFSKNANEESQKAVEERLNNAFEVISFYEVGKEDYVNYSFFTNTQKQELIDAVKQLSEAFDSYQKNLK